MTYAYQIINTGSNGILEFSFGGWANSISNVGAVSLGGANETPFYATFDDANLVAYQFAYYDDIEEQYVGTPVPGSTGISAGLVLSSLRVPNLGSGDLLDVGAIRPFILPLIATPSNSLYVPPIVPGDYNDDDTVDAADYTVWRDHMGQALTLPNEDPGTTPGQVTAEDYDLWKSHFGQTAGSGSGASANAAVPEPATSALLMFATAGWCLRRGRAA